MKISKKDIKIFLFSILGFFIFGFSLVYIQNRMFDNLLDSGRYTIGVGKKIEKRRTDSDFIYTYKVNDKVYEGSVVLSLGDTGMVVGGVYFVVFDSNKPKKSFLIKSPAVPVKINLEDIPQAGWAELPVQISKDSIIRF